MRNFKKIIEKNQKKYGMIPIWYKILGGHISTKEIQRAEEREAQEPQGNPPDPVARTERDAGSSDDDEDLGEL